MDYKIVIQRDMNVRKEIDHMFTEGILLYLILNR
jgi:hypothetical protein